MADGTAGVVFTVMAIGVELAVLLVTQPALEVMITLSVLPLVNVFVVYVGVDATVVPFNFHTYVGAVPPEDGLAEKVTRVPGQIVLEGEAVTVTEGVWPVAVLTVMPFDKAGLFETQDKAEVIRHSTTSPVVNVLFV